MDEKRIEFEKPEQSASGTDCAYTVEARYAYYEPKEFGGQLFDDRWQQVNFQKTNNGVPTKQRYQAYGDMFGLMSYQAAQALRWWFLAEVEVNSNGWCWETRIRPHQVDYSIKAKPLEPVDHFDFRGASKPKKEKTAE